MMPVPSATNAVPGVGAAWSAAGDPAPSSSGSGGTLSALAGAIPVVGGVISSLINNANTKAANAQNQQFQLQQQAQQNAYNLNMWKMQTAYNTPAAMMSRYKAAGLNPNLIYGTATGNVASPPPQAAKVDFVAQPRQAVNYGSDAAAGIMAYNNTRLASAQTNNLQAQSTNTAEDTVLKSALALVASTEAAKNQADLPLIPVLGAAQAANLNAGTQKAITDSQVESMLAPYDANVKSAQIANLGADTQFKIDDNVRQAALTSNTLAETIGKLSLMAQQKAQSQAEIQQIQANTQVLLNDNITKQMNNSMQQNGIMPHDSWPMRALQSIWNYVFGQGNMQQSTTGGTGVDPVLGVHKPGEVWK